MNEPANFGTNKEQPWKWPSNKVSWSLKCPNNDYDDPPYLPLAARLDEIDPRLSESTICMRGIQGDEDEFIHYNVHSLYGWSQAQPTLKYY